MGIADFPDVNLQQPIDAFRSLLEHESRWCGGPKIELILEIDIDPPRISCKEISLVNKGDETLPAKIPTEIIDNMRSRKEIEKETEIRNKGGTPGMILMVTGMGNIKQFLFESIIGKEVTFKLGELIRPNFV